MSFPDQDRIFKVMDKIKKGKVKPTKIIDKNSSPLDIMKFNICQQVIKFKRDHEYLNQELAEIIGVGPAIISRVLHCEIDRFKIDSLLNYYLCLMMSTKNKKLMAKVNKELIEFLKDDAA